MTNEIQGHRLLINGVDVATKRSQLEIRELKADESVTAVQQKLAKEHGDEVYFVTGDGHRLVAVGDGLNLSGLKKTKNGIPPVLEFDGKDAVFVTADDKLNTAGEAKVLVPLAVAGGLTYGAAHLTEKYGPMAVKMTKTGGEVLEQVTGQESALRDALADIRSELGSVREKLAEALKQVGPLTEQAKQLRKQLGAVDAAVRKIEVPHIPLIGRFTTLPSVENALKQTEKLTKMVKEVPIEEPLKQVGDMGPHLDKLLQATDRLTSLVSEKSLQIINSLKYMAEPLERAGSAMGEAVAHAPKAKGIGLLMAGVAGIVAAGSAVYGHFSHPDREAVRKATNPLQ